MDDNQQEVIDACVCINLAAALDNGIADLKGCTPMIVPQVADEALHLHVQTDQDVTQVRIDMSNVTTVELSVQEVAVYLRLAQRLDDGEAASLAVAITRGWSIATDDKSAIRAAAAADPPVQVITTGIALRRHAEACGWDHDRCAEAIRDVRDQAAFIPPSSDPEYAWWMSRL